MELIKSIPIFVFLLITLSLHCELSFAASDIIDGVSVKLLLLLLSIPFGCVIGAGLLCSYCISFICAKTARRVVVEDGIALKEPGNTQAEITQPKTADDLQVSPLYSNLDCP